MNDAQLAFANQHLRILSGLYGVRPLDDMASDSRWAPNSNKRGKTLYEFWGTKVTRR